MPTALVTGATSGIGLELATLLARDKHDLVLVGRAREKLKQLARTFQTDYGVSAYTFPVDLSDPGAPAKLHRALKHEGIHPDVLVNNAGFGSYGPFVESKVETQVSMIQVNASAVVHLTGLFLPHMVRKGHGRILNVASLAGFQPGPLMATYYATKAFVIWFSEALAEELAGTGVTVTALCPGPTRTAFRARANMAGSRLFSGHVLKVMDARPVAEAGYRAMQRGKVIAIPGGLSNHLMVFSNRLAPRFVVRKVVRLLQARRLRAPRSH